MAVTKADKVAEFQQLEAAFKAQGIRFVIAPDAVNYYLFGWKTDFVLYTENVTSGEVLNILHQLAREDRKFEEQRYYEDLLAVSSASPKQDVTLLQKKGMGNNKILVPASSAS